MAIEGIAIRNGDDTGIQINGVGGTRISGVDFFSPDDNCVELNDTTPNVVIEDSRFRSCGGDAVGSELSNGLQLLSNSFEGTDGVDVTGDDVLAERNTWSRSGGTCLAIDGANAVVTGNRFDRCGAGIAIDGSDASITRNTFTNTDGDAINVEGDDPVVESNPITGTGATAIELFCDASCGTARIFRNRITSIGGTAIAAESLDAGLQIEANQISQAQGAGLVLDTLGANVVDNRVSAAGDAGGECIDLEGDDERVTGNGLASCGGDGIQIEGDDNTIEENRVSGSAGDDGIDVQDDGVGNSRARQPGERRDRQRHRGLARRVRHDRERQPGLGRARAYCDRAPPRAARTFPTTPRAAATSTTERRRGSAARRPGRRRSPRPRPTGSCSRRASRSRPRPRR